MASAVGSAVSVADSAAVSIGEGFRAPRRRRRAVANFRKRQEPRIRLGFGRRRGLGVIRGMFGSELLLVLYLADRFGNGRAFGILGFDRRFIFDCGFVGRLRLGVFVLLGRFPVQHLIPAPRLRRAAIAAMPARTPIPIVLIFGGALGAALFVDQGLPVGDRDLIVVR